LEFVSLNVTDTESVRELAATIGGKVDILINTAEHHRPGGIMERGDVQIAREEMDIGYFGLMRLAQAFGPAMRSRGADGTNNACAWVNLISVYGHLTWPAFGAHSAMQAAVLAATQSLRAEFRSGGIRVINIFSGPLETEWFQTVPPPKVAVTQLANAVIHALEHGIEDHYLGDVAKDFRARLDKNPKALERELG
jgi:NAD(P)-dependent dehydrogenase (short-subunit alcohol dehydrogenase family)